MSRPLESMDSNCEIFVAKKAGNTEVFYSITLFPRLGKQIRHNRACRVARLLLVKTKLGDDTVFFFFFKVKI